MARYIDADALLNELKEELEFDSPMYNEVENKWLNKGLRIAINDVKRFSTADVAPRAEVEKLQAECNKWQECLKTECEYTEAITKKKVVREIIGEILSTHTPDVDGFFTIHETELTELKKKYTEGEK